MKITFEGNTFHDVLDQMQDAIAIAEFLATKNISKSVSEKSNKSAIPPAAPVKPQGPGPDVFSPVENSVDKSVDPQGAKPVKPVNPQIAKMQAAKAAKKAEREAAAAAPKEKALPPPPKTAEGMDPAEVVALRTKTIAELQEAYANGHQKEVFELLSRFGNGAKSFRELPPDAFVPIREAIDNGALT
jgi:hypothetical protein